MRPDYHRLRGSYVDTSFSRISSSISGSGSSSSNSSSLAEGGRAIERESKSEKRSVVESKPATVGYSKNTEYSN